MWAGRCRGRAVSAVEGMWIAPSSPARSSRASFLASFLSLPAIGCGAWPHGAARRNLDLVAGLLRYLGRGDNDAVVAELEQAAGEHEAGRPGLPC